MRSVTALAAVALSVVCLSSPAQAQNSDVMGQVQKFFNNGNGSDDRAAYERGRQDELRRQQADRDRARYRRERDRDRDLGRYDRDRDQRHRAPEYGYNR
ncbi:MAG: hypothetical protein WDN25_25330 [Acetobacteraceae bacterium]